MNGIRSSKTHQKRENLLVQLGLIMLAHHTVHTGSPTSMKKCIRFFKLTHGKTKLSQKLVQQEEAEVRVDDKS